MASYLKIGFIFLIFVLYFQFGYSLDCYECTGGTGSPCDLFDKNHPHVQLKYCGEPENGSHCLQHAVKIKNHRRMGRSCVQLKEGDRNPCTEMIAVEVSRRDYYVLHCSMCQIGNGCNSEIPIELKN